MKENSKALITVLREPSAFVPQKLEADDAIDDSIPGVITIVGKNGIPKITMPASMFHAAISGFFP